MAYSPWVNGTVESAMRSVLSAMRAMLMELKLGPQDWTSVLPAIATAINESGLERLGRRPDGTARSPLEVMSRIAQKRQVLRILPSAAGYLQSKTISHAPAVQTIKINEPQSSLTSMHKNIHSLVTKRREQAIAKHDVATNIVSPSFSVGDFVLVRQAADRGHKLRFKLFGPCRFTAIHGSLIYSVTTLSDAKTERVHAARLLKYDDSLQGTEVPQAMIDLADKTESRYELIDKIVDIREEKDQIWLRVVWDGLPDQRD